MKRNLDENTSALLKKFSGILEETNDTDDERLFQMYVKNEDNKDFVELSALALKLYQDKNKRKRKHSGS